jgi:uncharacterized protein
MADMVELGSRRVLQPGKLLWLRAVGWGVGMTLLIAIPTLILAGLVAVAAAIAGGVPLERLEALPEWATYPATYVAVLTMVGCYVLAVRLGEDRSVSELAPRPALTELPAGLAIGALMMSVAVGLMVATGWASVSPAPVTTVSRALAMTAQSGVMEEIFFRLIVFRLLWRAFGAWAALALSAVLFGGLHITNPNASWFAAICIMIEAGIMLATFYILTGRIWVSIGVHAGWNFTQGWIFGAPVSGTDLFDGGPFDFRPAEDVPAYLSGGGFGPEASLAGLLVGSAVGAGCLWKAWKRGALYPDR